MDRGSLPAAEPPGQLLARNGKGEWFYVNHAGTWQTCPPPFPPASQPGGVEAKELREAAQTLLDGCLSDFGDDPSEASDEPVAAGQEGWKSAITFGMLHRLQAALAPPPGDAREGGR